MSFCYIILNNVNIRFIKSILHYFWLSPKHPKKVLTKQETSNWLIDNTKHHKDFLIYYIVTNTR